MYTVCMVCVLLCGGEMGGGFCFFLGFEDTGAAERFTPSLPGGPAGRSPWSPEMSLGVMGFANFCGRAIREDFSFLVGFSQSS